MIPLGVIPKLWEAEEKTDHRGIVSELIVNDQMRENMKQDLNININPFQFGFKEKVKELADAMHQQALLTPDPSDDNIDYLQYLHEAAGRAMATHFMPEGFQDFIIYCMAMTNQFSHTVVQWVFAQIYKFVTHVVILTPEWIFDNSWFPQASTQFTTFGIAMIIIFTMLEGLKCMLGVSSTPFLQTIKKLPVMLGVSAATPYLFSNGIKWLNKLTNIILDMASNSIQHAASPTVSALSLAFDPANIIVMLIFLLMVLVLWVPIFLFNAKRWFNLLMSAMITPLAMSAWLFQSTQTYFHMWLRNISNLALSQLAYALYISVLGAIMFGTPNPTTWVGIMSKMTMMIGGLYYLAFPPQIVRSFASGGGMVEWYNASRRKLQTYQQRYEKVKTSVNEGNTGNVLVGAARIAGKLIRR